MRRIYKAVLVALLAGMALTTPAIAAKEERQPHLAAMSAPAVDVYRVGKAKKIPVTLEYSARLIGMQNAIVAAQIKGVLVKKHFTEGSYVRKGDSLYTIEPNTYQVALNRAKAALELEKANLNKAERDWERAKGLYADGALSDQEKDAALAAYESASASVKIVEAEFQEAIINLNYTDVKAPINAIAGMKLNDIGNWVEEGTPLVEITQINPIYAEFSIPDLDIIKKHMLKKEQRKHTASKSLKALLSINGTLYEHEGNIDFFSPKIDPQTGTLKARAVFKNPNKELIPGTFAKIKILGLSHKETVVIPQKAVLQTPAGTIVFVVMNGKAVRKPVTIGDSVGQDFIIEKGVQENEMVIVNNFFRIKPDMSVRIDKTINAEDK